MVQKFVVRLLNEQGELLAWQKVMATAAPQRPRAGSCPFFAPGRETMFLIERDGRASHISVHWCDVDVARHKELAEAVDVKAGQVMRFSWLEPVWLVYGEKDVPLPTVTEQGSVTVEVEPAALGLAST